MLAGLDVPYIAAHPVEFQTLEQWEDDPRGLLPVEATMMVAIPELDGGIWPMTFGGRSRRGRCRPVAGIWCRIRNGQPCSRRAWRVWSSLRAQGPRPNERSRWCLFNFPPNAGTVGIGCVSVGLRVAVQHAARDGGGRITVDVPANVDALRDRMLGGNAALFGANANVAAQTAGE